MLSGGVRIWELAGSEQHKERVFAIRQERGIKKIGSPKSLRHSQCLYNCLTDVLHYLVLFKTLTLNPNIWLSETISSKISPYATAMWLLR